MTKIFYDQIGTIAILPENEKSPKKIASKILGKGITTVLQKISKTRGKLRTYKLRYIAGIKTTEAIHKENSCNFKLDIAKCYFSPRLSNERLELAKEIKKSNAKSVLVLFAGVAPFSIVIAKLNPEKQITSVEINKTASKYAEQNVKLNKLTNVQIIQKDVKKFKPKNKYDIIVMARAQIPYTFLKEAFSFSKKGTIIYYYDFVREEDYPQKTIKTIQEQAKKSRKRIKILRFKKAGDIGPYKYRIRVDFKII